MKGIESVIKKTVEEFCSSIVAKYPEIKSEDLEKYWNDISNTVKISGSFQNKIVKSIISNTDDTDDTESVTSKTGSSSGCPYEFIKGKEKGTTCNSKPTGGKTYCSRHKKYEGVIKKEKKVIPIPKKSTIKPLKSDKPTSIIVKSMPRLLYTHKIIGKLYHPETMLVFRSQDERLVIGKIVDDKIVGLTDEDIDTCRKWGYAFSKCDDGDDGDDGDDTKTKSSEEKLETKYFISKSSEGSKFWEVTVKDTSYSTRSGKVGKVGIVKNKKFPSNNEAIKEMKKNICLKMNKGYSLQLSENEKISSSYTKKAKSESENEESDDNNNFKTDVFIDEVGGPLSDYNSDKDIDENELPIIKSFITKALGIKGR